MEASLEKKKEQSLRDLWYNNIRSNICIIGVAEGEEKTIEIRSIWRNKGWKRPQIGQRDKPLESRSWAILKQDKLKEIYPKTQHNQTSKNFFVFRQKAVSEKQHITHSGRMIWKTVDF